MNKRKNRSITKKNVTAAAGVLMAVAILGTGPAFADASIVSSGVSGVEASVDTSVKKSRIGAAAAKKKALADAGLSSSEVIITKAKLDEDDGVYYYDVEFYSEKAEYEYEIDAYTGKVLKKETESFKTTKTDKKSRIGVTAAKKKALNNANVSASEATFTKTKLKEDDGVYYYDIEFYTDDAEYEYEIQAYTGKVIDKDVEERKSSNSKKTRIGVSRAKEIALKHAEVSSSKAKFTKAKLDKDDDEVIYEIEFYAGGVEYEYDIDAYTGKILSFDADYDD